MDNSLQFDFDFTGPSRADLLSEAQRTISGLGSELGREPGPGGESGSEAAQRLLSQLGQSIVELGAYPEVIQLKEEHFSEHGFDAPKRFKDLSKLYRFYWLRIPLTLQPAENMPFVKLQCAVEFNPDTREGHLRPRAHMILPDRKFKKLLELSDSLELGIGENFEFEAAAGIPKLQAGKLKAEAEGGVSAKAAGRLGFIVGPFTYTLKRAQVEHSPTDTEKVFWRLEGAEFFQEDEPTLIVVLKVPIAVKEVQIAAALEASHKFNLLAADLGDALLYFRERVANFFRKGAPIQSPPRVWDITPHL